jgi:hypothetical protein
LLLIAVRKSVTTVLGPVLELMLEAKKYPTTLAMIASTTKIDPRMSKRLCSFFGSIVSRCGRGARGSSGGVSTRVIVGGRLGMARISLVRIWICSLIA